MPGLTNNRDVVCTKIYRYAIGRYNTYKGAASDYSQVFYQSGGTPPLTKRVGYLQVGWLQPKRMLVVVLSSSRMNKGPCLRDQRYNVSPGTIPLGCGSDNHQMG